MLRSILATAAAITLTFGSAGAQIELAPNFTVTGFIDMSILSDDGDVGMAMDQLEIDFIAGLGEGLSVQADIQGNWIYIVSGGKSLVYLGQSLKMICI